MGSVKLIADSGATKVEWGLLSGDKRKIITTKGISPYFLTPEEIQKLLEDALLPKLKTKIDEVHFYGTGLFDPRNVQLMKKVLKKLFPGASYGADIGVIGSLRTNNTGKLFGLQDIIHRLGNIALHPNHDVNRFYVGGIYNPIKHVRF